MANADTKEKLLNMKRELVRLRDAYQQDGNPNTLLAYHNVFKAYKKLSMALPKCLPKDFFAKKESLLQEEKNLKSFSNVEISDDLKNKTTVDLILTFLENGKKTSFQIRDFLVDVRKKSNISMGINYSTTIRDKLKKLCAQGKIKRIESSEPQKIGFIYEKLNSFQERP